METPYFKRLVQLHVNLKYKQALKDGRIRLASGPNTIYMPRVDIVDDSSSSRVEATFELPGVRNDEVTVNLHKGKLHVHGERHPRSPQPLRGTSDQLAPNHMDVDPSLHRITLPVQELKYGKFQRTLDVPSSLQHTDITARFQDGLLVVTWPRLSGIDVTLHHTDAQNNTSVVTE